MKNRFITCCLILAAMYPTSVLFSKSKKASIASVNVQISAYVLAQKNSNVNMAAITKSVANTQVKTTPATTTVSASGTYTP